MPQIIDEKYVVLDVETNGLSVTYDDLLSISIFKPNDAKMFNRFLPLELARKVYTTHINGITKDDLRGARPLTQQDVNNIIIEFDLENRTILTYSSFDERVLKNYFKRKHLSGFEKFHFYNFKNDIISSRFSGGNITKDNLCKLYKIENVNNIHSSENDCILEWELFKRMNGNKLLITNDNVFEFNNEYIIPVSLLASHPNLKRCMNNLPNIDFQETTLKRFVISDLRIKKFPTNFNGMIIENLINSMLGVEQVDSSCFLLENKRKLKYIGKLPSYYDEVVLDFKSDGSVKEVYEKDKEKAKELNEVISVLKNELIHLIEYITQNIFSNKKIKSQELVIDKEHNILAKCDLSDDNNVLEIKTNYLLDIHPYKEQLYFEANGRNCYILRIDWRQIPNRVEFIISKVDLFISEEYNSIRSLEHRTQQFQEKIKNDDIIVTEYVDLKTKVKLKCMKCDNEWESTCNSIVKKPQCPFCSPIIEHVSKEKAKLNEDEKKRLKALNYISKLIKISNGTLKAMNYVGSKDNVDVECLKCGHKWNIRADHLLSRAYCPMCKKNGMMN